MVLRCVDDYLHGQRYPLEMLRYVDYADHASHAKVTAI
jgi:hypothetical protein